MATIGDILTDIDSARYPNAFTAAQKVVWANEILRKIYKYTNKYTSTTIATTAGGTSFALPTGVLFENIILLKIDTTEYEYAPQLYKPLGGNYYFRDVDDKIGIYPATELGHTININYVKQADLLSASTLTGVPDINPDYHSLITNYICMIAASSGPNPDTEISNIFTVRFNDDWNRFIKDWGNAKINKPTKQKSNPWW